MEKLVFLLMGHYLMFTLLTALTVCIPSFVLIFIIINKQYYVIDLGMLYLYMHTILLPNKQYSNGSRCLQVYSSRYTVWWLRQMSILTVRIPSLPTDFNVRIPPNCYQSNIRKHPWQTSCQTPPCDLWERCQNPFGCPVSIEIHFAWCVVPSVL